MDTYMTILTTDGQWICDTRLAPGDGVKQAAQDIGAWAILNDGLDNFGTMSATVDSDTYASGNGGIIHGAHVGVVNRTVKLQYLGPVFYAQNKSDRAMTRARQTQTLSMMPDVNVNVQYSGGALKSFTGKIVKSEISCGNIYEPMDMTITIACPDPYIVTGTRTKNYTYSSGTKASSYAEFTKGYGLLEHYYIGLSDGAAEKILTDTDGYLVIYFPDGETLILNYAAFKAADFDSMSTDVTVKIDRDGRLYRATIAYKALGGASKTNAIVNGGFWQSAKVTTNGSVSGGVQSSFDGVFIKTCETKVSSLELML